MALEFAAIQLPLLAIIGANVVHILYLICRMALLLCLFTAAHGPSLDPTAVRTDLCNRWPLKCDAVTVTMDATSYPGITMITASWEFPFKFISFEPTPQTLAVKVAVKSP